MSESFQPAHADYLRDESRRVGRADRIAFPRTETDVLATLGKRVSQRRAQAEYYLLQGQLGPAIEQLQFAQKETDGDFYELSAVDARLRELRKLQMEEEKKGRNGG